MVSSSAVTSTTTEVSTAEGFTLGTSTEVAADFNTSSTKGLEY